MSATMDEAKTVWLTDARVNAIAKELKDVGCTLEQVCVVERMLMEAFEEGQRCTLDVLGAMAEDRTQLN